DMMISNYVYEKIGVTQKAVINYHNVLPQNTIISWKEIGRFHIGQYILMHSVIYRTELLKICKLELPKHTFYVDNIYVYYPLPHVTSIYYLDVNFYRYFIGREDQSVNEKNMIARVDQQLFVTKQMIDMYSLRKISNKKLRNYMINYLAIMMTVSSIILIRSKIPENLKKKKDLWKYLKSRDYRVYWKIRYSILGHTMNLPGKSGRKISIMAYKVARRLFGFN
ncbi:MAG: glycosyl transferase, partial [Lachnospiraceae bacterium]